MVRHVAKIGHHKDMFCEGIGLCAQIVGNNLRSMNNIIRKLYVIKSREKESFVCISTLILKLKFTIFAILIANWMRQLPIIPNG
jgi:hypothetical protein